MSNPIAAKMSELSLDNTQGQLIKAWYIPELKVYPDPTFSTQKELDEINERLKGDGSIEKSLDLFMSKSNIILRPSVLMRPAVDAGLVFNEGASMRLLAITQDSSVMLRKRSRLSAMARTLLLSAIHDGCNHVFDEWGVEIEGRGGDLDGWLYINKDDVVKRTETYFMASGGTQCSLGRLKKALPTTTLHTLRPVTKQEADDAYTQCGFYHGSYWESVFPEWASDYYSLWPILADGEGACVTINKEASLGFPYLAPGKNAEALSKVLEVVAFMERSFDWERDAGGTFRRMITTQPGFVLFMGKTKADVYNAEKIKAGQMRYYLVMPGHLKLYVQRLLQPFAGAKVSIGDIFNGPIESLYDNLAIMHSAQKHGLTGRGPTQLILLLEVQLHKYGYAFAHCGDDTVMCFYRAAEHRAEDGTTTYERQLVILGWDMSNFDLTQRGDVFAADDDRLQQGMARIDENRAGLWREIRRGRLTLLHGAGAGYVEGTGTSGIPGQSEKNDMDCHTFCVRVIKDITAHPYTGRSFTHYDEVVCHDRSPPMFLLRRDRLDEIAARHGRELGLDVRLEYVRSGRAFPGPFSALTLKTGVVDELEHYSLQATMMANMMSFVFLGYHFVPQECIGRNNLQSDYQYMSINGHLEREDRDEGRRVNPYGLRYTQQEASEFANLCEYSLMEEAFGGVRTNPFSEADYFAHMDGFCVIPDMGRYLTNIMYPSKGYVKNDDEFEAYDVLRLYGMLLSSGALFTHELFKWYARAPLQALLEQARLSLSKDARERPNLPFVVMEEESVFLGDLEMPRDRLSLLNQLFPLPLVKKLHEIWDPTRPGKRPRRTLGVAASSYIPRPVVETGASWADIMETEEEVQLQAVLGGDITVAFDTARFAGNLQGLALRALTKKNWGRPPPSVPVRHVGGVRQNPVVASGEPRQGRTKSQKRRDSRARQRARERDEEETHRHLQEAREEERDRLELEARVGRRREVEFDMDELD